MIKFARSTTKIWLTTILLSLGLILGGCTQEDINALTANTETADTSPSASSSTNANLSGTAATGAAIVGHIVITDVNGQTNTNVVINADGTFSADVTNMSPPFILSAIPDDPTLPTQYSYADAANITVNVTPLTSLAMFIANGQQDLASFANSWISQNNQITEAGLETAKAQINSIFSAQFQEHGINSNTYDFFSTPFAADHTSFDAVLDSLAINIDMTGGSFSIKVNDVPFNFNSSANSPAQSDSNTPAPGTDTTDPDSGASVPGSNTSNPDSTAPDSSDDPDSDSSNVFSDDDDNDTTDLETWELTITGTVITAGFPGEVAETTTSNLSTPATADDIEDEIIFSFAYGTVEGDVIIDMDTAEDDLVIYAVSFDATGMSYSLFYTYTKVAI